MNFFQIVKPFEEVSKFYFTWTRSPLVTSMSRNLSVNSGFLVSLTCSRTLRSHLQFLIDCKKINLIHTSSLHFQPHWKPWWIRLPSWKRSNQWSTGIRTDRPWTWSRPERSWFHDHPDTNESRWHFQPQPGFFRINFEQLIESGTSKWAKSGLLTVCDLRSRVIRGGGTLGWNR